MNTNQKGKRSSPLPPPFVVGHAEETNRETKNTTLVWGQPRFPSQPLLSQRRLVLATGGWWWWFLILL